MYEGETSGRVLIFGAGLHVHWDRDELVLDWPAMLIRHKCAEILKYLKKFKQIKKNKELIEKCLKYVNLIIYLYVKSIQGIFWFLHATGMFITF